MVILKNAEEYAIKALNDGGIQISDTTKLYTNISQSDLESYWKEQIDTAYDVFEDTINSYDGAGGQNFLRNLISNMVKGGSDLSDISTAVTQVIESEDMQNAINDYWESLVDPNIDSEKALSKVKSIFDGIVAQFPELAGFFDNFYNQIATGGSNAAESVETSANKMTDSLEGVTKTLSTLQGKYNELKSAQDEYNSTGAISAETMQKLIDNDLLQYLDYSSGKLRINTDALLAEGEAAKVNAIQKLQDAMATDLMNLATGKTDQLSNTAKTAIANLGDAAETTGGQAETAAAKLAGFAIAAQAAKDGAEGNLSRMSVEDFNAQADAIIAAYTSAANSIGGITIRSPKSSGGSSSQNKPDYEDPTEAIIDRINLRHRELEQQEEYIQNALEIAEIENDYKKQISLTNDLIATRKNRVEELNKANAGLHNEAEYLRNSNPWNEEAWFDGLGNATEECYKVFNSASKEQQEVIKDLFDNLSKYKKAYAENAEEIAEINKEILQSEKDIANLREENYNEVLDEIQRYADEVSDYYDDINDKLDDRITKEEALLQIMQGQTDATSKLMDVQTEIDKAIRDSRISLQYLDEKEREGTVLLLRWTLICILQI